MDDKSLSGLFSAITPDDPEISPGLGDINETENNNLLTESLKAFAVQSGGGMEQEVNGFLSGKGALLETTKNAVARGGSSASGEVAAVLSKQFNLPAAIAKIISSILVRLFPDIKKLTGPTTTSKAKTRRSLKIETHPSTRTATSKKRKKVKTSSATKPAASTKRKKTRTTTVRKSTSSKRAKRYNIASSLEIADEHKPE
jgi:hypothetical protein